MPEVFSGKMLSHVRDAEFYFTVAVDCEAINKAYSLLDEHRRLAEAMRENIVKLARLRLLLGANPSEPDSADNAIE